MLPLRLQASEGIGSPGISSYQWRVFHRSKISIAYPAFMRKKRKDKMNALFLYSNNNYCTTVMPYFGIPEYYIKFTTTQQSYRRAPLVLPKYPGISRVALFTRNPPAHALSQWWFRRNSLNCFHFPLKQTLVQFAEVEF